MCRKAHFRRGPDDDDSKGIEGALEGASQLPPPPPSPARGDRPRPTQDARGLDRRTGEWTRTRRGAEPLETTMFVTGLRQEPHTAPVVMEGLRRTRAPM